MQRETAKDLLQLITNTASMAFDADQKATALEKALEESDANLYEAYKTELALLKRSQPAQWNLAALSGLLERLSQN
jgi:hypothetical protein